MNGRSPPRSSRPRGPGQLRWRRVFKSRSKQVRSLGVRGPRQAAPAENLKGTLFACGPGAAPAGARAQAIPLTPSPALPEQARERVGRGGTLDHRPLGSRQRRRRRARRPQKAGRPAPLSEEGTGPPRGPGAGGDKTGCGLLACGESPRTPIRAHGCLQVSLPIPQRLG